MFNGATAFNQDIGGWTVSNVNSMRFMFRSATAFNNGGSSDIENWSAPLCTNFLLMFQSASSFNQPLTSLVNTSGVGSCIMTSMFQNAISFNQNLNTWNMTNTTRIDSMFYNDSITPTPTTVCIFNNGQLGFVTISGTPSTATYTNSTRTLTCTGALFSTELTTSDVLLITTSSSIYSSAIESITDNTTLVLVTAFGSNLTEGTILSITKQIPGTAPLTWNLQNTTLMSNAFRNCTYFNQNISRMFTSKCRHI
jgi:hypothetical protein